MNMEKKIFICFLFAALLITAGCRKDDTPAEVKTPVGFRARSQTAVVKADANDNNDPLSNYHQDFGVWGIATEAINHPYVLWKDSTFEKVEQVGNSINYAPVTDAYWLTGYSYNFLALAPYENGVNNLTINKNLATDNQSANPSISFTYDMSGKYNPTVQGQTPNYTYDLLGAAASHKVKRNEIPVSQDLVFWHLFSRIKIRVNFDGSTGSVQAIRLHNVDQDIAYSISPSSDVQTPAVACTNTSKTTTVNPISFTTSSSNYYDEDKDGEKEWYLSIVPQNISDFKMFLDFTTKIDGNDVVVRDYEIDLSPAKDKPDYTYNNQYNWNITIGPKQAITFNVTVTPWTTVGPDDDGGIPEIEIK